MGDGFTQDHGERHGVDEELELAVPPISGVLPGPLVFRAIESDQIESSFETFDTPDGEAHSVGRNKTSKDLQLTLLTSDSATIALLERWHDAARMGMPGSKPTVTATKFYADGSASRVRELLRCFPKVVRDSGTGQQQASTVQVVLKYKDAETVVA